MILINAASKDSLKIFQPMLPPYLPISVGCLLAVAEKEGIKARFIDEYVEKDVLGLVDEFIKELEPPYIFGFSVFTAAYKNAINRSRQLKRLYPDSVVIFGSVHPTALPEEVLQHDHIDIVFRGEADRLLPELYRSIKEGRDYSKLPNISFRKNGKIVHNERETIIKDINSLPPFPYHLFNPKHYDMGVIVSSRGCPYKCIFCSNRVTTGFTYRYRPPEVVVEEIEMLNKKYGRASIQILDDNFLVNKKRIYDLLEIIRRKGLEKKMTFNFQARGDNVNYQVLKDLYDGGFKSIFFGIETASEEIMKTIQKGETVKQCLEAVKMAKKIGYFVSATFIYALPGETHKDRMAAVKLSKEIGLDSVRFNNATPYPGTTLYDIAKKENRLNIVGDYENFYSVSTFIESPFKKIPFTYVPEGNSENEIRQDILFSYLSFFMDYRKLIGIVKNADQASGWVKSKGEFLEFIRKLPTIVVLFFLLSVKFLQLFFSLFSKKKSSLKAKDFLKAFRGLIPMKN